MSRKHQKIPRRRVVVLGPWRKSGRVKIRPVWVVIPPVKPRSGLCHAMVWDAIWYRNGVQEVRVGGSPHKVRWADLEARGEYVSFVNDNEDDETAAWRALRDSNSSELEQTDGFWL